MKAITFSRMTGIYCRGDTAAFAEETAAKLVASGAATYAAIQPDPDRNPSVRGYFAPEQLADQRRPPDSASAMPMDEQPAGLAPAVAEAAATAATTGTRRPARA